MSNNGNINGSGTAFPTRSEFSAASSSDRAEPVVIRGFTVSYDRTFNLGDHEFLNPAATIQVRVQVPEGEAFDLHDARERVRRMARENVRAQLLGAQDKDEVVFLGLQPPKDGRDDPVSVESISLSLIQTVNLGRFNSITPGFSDWMDVQEVAGSPGELHMALARMWASLWANIQDEVSRARGNGSTGAFFGLPPITTQDWTAVSGRPVPNGLKHSARSDPPANGQRRKGLTWRP